MSDEATPEEKETPAFQFERPGFDIKKHPLYRKLKNLPSHVEEEGSPKKETLPSPSSPTAVELAQETKKRRR